MKVIATLIINSVPITTINKLIVEKFKTTIYVFTIKFFYVMI